MNDPAGRPLAFVACVIATVAVTGLLASALVLSPGDGPRDPHEGAEHQIDALLAVEPAHVEADRIVR